MGHLFRKSLLSMLGLAFIIFVIVVAAAAPLLANQHPQYVDRGDRVVEDWGLDLKEKRLPPSEEHPFGTNRDGNDIYSMVLYGAQKSLRIGLVVVGIGVGVGTIVGAIAGYYGGRIDEVLMRLTDLVIAFPALILAMAVVAALGRSLDNIMLAVAVVFWPVYARIVRGQVLSVRENQFVEAAKSVGASDLRIIFRHVLPNSWAPVIVQATLDIGATILIAAGLSFIGLGPPPGTAELGLMVSEGRKLFPTDWWSVTYPGLAITVIVLGFNLLGDGLRDVMDPKLRR